MSAGTSLRVYLLMTACRHKCDESGPGEYFFSDLYGVLFLIFYDETPMYYIQDMSYYASYLFIILLLLYVSEGVSVKMVSWVQLLIPVFTISMGVFFVVTSGDIPGNIICVIEMTIALWLALGGVLLERQKAKVVKRDSLSGRSVGEAGNTEPNKCPFYRVCLCILFLEYGFWITSSFWVGDTLLNPYFWVDALFCISFICMLFAIKKAVPCDTAEGRAS